MQVSLPGLLKNAGRAADIAEPSCGYGFMLDQLLRHLTELRDRNYDGDRGVVEEFFKLYVVEL